MDDLKSAWRSLLSTPGSTFVVVVTLAIGIGANTAIFSVIDGVLLRPLGYGDESRLVVLWSTYESDIFRLSPADYRDVRDDTAAFDGQVGLYRNVGSTLSGLEQPVRVGSMAVTPRLFSVLATKAAAGRLFGPEDERPGGGRNVVITAAAWTRRFGADAAIIGSSIEVDGQPRTVVGVTEPGFQFPPGNHEVEIFFPMAFDNTVLPDRDHRMFDAVARLAPATTIDAAAAELAAVAGRLARQFPDTNDGWGLMARPLREEVFGDLSTTLWVLSGAVFLVLLIACANIANVLVARSAAAGREFALRAALGAGRGDLVKRSLAESLVLGLLGGAGGVLLGSWGGALLRAVIPDSIPRGEAIGMDGSVLVFAALLSIGSTVLFGSLPARRGVAPNLLQLVGSGDSSATMASGGRLRGIMVMIEVALAVVLLVSAGLMVRSFARLSEVDPGFRQQDVVAVAVQLPRSRYSVAEWRPFFERLVQRVGQLPGIAAAGAVSDLPASNVGLGFELEFSVSGLGARAPTARPNADFRLVLPGYFEAMDMNIVRGRAFEALDLTGDRRVAIVNETVVERYFADVDPIGRSLSVAAMGELEIVGVVADIRHSGLQSKYESEIFVPFGRPVGTAEMHIVAQSRLETAAIANAIGGVLTDMDPQLVPSQVVAISDLLWESIAQPRFNAALLAILSLCGAILAAIGTYGIVAYTVSQRTREIGLRMALGADASATVRLVVSDALVIVLSGAILGVFGALGATRFMARLLFEVPPTDPLTYAAVLAGALLVGLVAAWAPAQRASRIEPVAALRGG